MKVLKYAGKFICVCLLTIFLISPFFYKSLTAAQISDYVQKIQAEIENLRNQIKEKEEISKKLNEEKKALSEQIKTTQKKETTLKNQITQFDQRIKKLAVDIQITETKISKNILTIQELEMEIKRNDDVISKNRKNLAEIIKEIKSYDEANFLEILLKNKKISIFLSEAEHVRRLQAETQKRLEEIKLTKFKLGEEKIEIEGIKNELENLNTELDGQKRATESQKNDKEYLFKITKNQETNYQKLLTKAEKQQQAIQQDILDLEDKLRYTIDSSKIPAPRHGIFAWPHDGRLTQRYGPTSQTGFINDAYKFHNGIDIAAGFGSPIKAAKDGVVVAIGNNGKYAYGRWIAIEHDNGLTTLYAHLSSQIVNSGQKVKEGQNIGYEGSTGFSTGSHLHFTVYATSTFTTEERWFGLLPLGGSLNPLDYL